MNENTDKIEIDDEFIHLLASIKDVEFLKKTCEKFYEKKIKNKKLYEMFDYGFFAKVVLHSNIDCLKYLHWELTRFNVDSVDKFGWNELVVNMAARCGKLQCLKYAIDNNCEYTVRTSECAAEFGRLECLKYLINDGCYCNIFVCMSKAAENGHIKCFEYLHELSKHGEIMNDRTGINASDHYSPFFDCWKPMIKSFKSGIGNKAATSCDVECIRFAHENGYKLGRNSFASVLNNTNKPISNNMKLQCIKYIEECGYKLDTNLLALAIQKKNFLCVKYMHDQGIKFDDRCCNNGLFSKNKDIRQLIEKSIPFKKIIKFKRAVNKVNKPNKIQIKNKTIENKYSPKNRKTHKDIIPTHLNLKREDNIFDALYVSSDSE